MADFVPDSMVLGVGSYRGVCTRWEGYGTSAGAYSGIRARGVWCYASEHIVAFVPEGCATRRGIPGPARMLWSTCCPKECPFR
eukprot:478506-Rhodomonas_salina.1